MIDYLMMAAIGGRAQQARLLQEARFQDRRKEEDAFYARTGSSSLVRFIARLMLPTDRTAGRMTMRPGKDKCQDQAARLTRP